MPLPLFMGQDQNDAFQNWLKKAKPASPYDKLDALNMTRPGVGGGPESEPGAYPQGEQQNISLMPDTRQNMNYTPPQQQFMSLLPQQRSNFSEPTGYGYANQEGADAAPSSGSTPRAAPGWLGSGEGADAGESPTNRFVPKRGVNDSPAPPEDNPHSPLFQPTDRRQLRRSAVPNYLVSSNPNLSDLGNRQPVPVWTGAPSQPAASFGPQLPAGPPSYLDDTTGPPSSLAGQPGKATAPPQEPFGPPKSLAGVTDPAGSPAAQPTSTMQIDMPGYSLTRGFTNGQYSGDVGGSINGRPIDLKNVPANQSVQDYLANQSDPTKWYKDLRRMINPTYAYGQVGQDAGETPATRQQFSDAMGFIQGNSRDAAHLGSVAREGDLNRKNALQIAQMNVDERAGSVKDAASIQANQAVMAEKAKWEKEHPGFPFPAKKEKEIRDQYQPSVTGGPLAGDKKAGGISLPPAKEMPPEAFALRDRLGGDAFDEIDKLLNSKTDNNLHTTVTPSTTIRKIMESGKDSAWISKNLDAIVPYLQLKHGDEAIKSHLGLPQGGVGGWLTGDYLTGRGVKPDFAKPFGVGEQWRNLTGNVTSEDRANQAMRKWLAQNRNGLMPERLQD